MVQELDVAATGEQEPSLWRETISVVLMIPSFFVGLFLGWYCFLFALEWTSFPFLGLLVPPVFGVAAWRARRVRWMCALFVGVCAAAAGSWVMFVLLARALADF